MYILKNNGWSVSPVISEEAVIDDYYFLASGLSKIENRQKDLGCRIQQILN